jgi:hypothetical protein
MVTSTVVSYMQTLTQINDNNKNKNNNNNSTCNDQRWNGMIEWALSFEVFEVGVVFYFLVPMGTQREA